MPTAILTDPQVIVQQAVKKVTMIATLPEVTSRIVQTVEDPQSTASQLHAIVAHDPALVTRILKIVNSAFYGLPGQIGSVERAIVLLGLNAVKNLAVAASLGQLFRSVKLCEGFSARDLWKHCIAVGVATRDLARQMKLPIVEEAFLAGIIHDVGILVSLQLWPEQLRTVCNKARDQGDFCQIERDILGVDHEQLGAGLAAHWRFPRPCQLVAGYHHRPTMLADDARLLVTLVYVADTICSQQKHGFDLAATHQRLEDAGLGEMGIDPLIVQRTVANLDKLVQVAGTLLGG